MSANQGPSHPELGSPQLGPSLVDSLRASFGHEEFRPGQEEVVRRALGGENLFVVMPTGAGKSLCYQLPALMKSGVAVVVSPLIALMKDQVDALLDRRVKGATYINSSLPWHEVRRRIAELSHGKHKLVYVAPERFRDPGFVRALRELEIAFLVVDEAHCISEWGHDFRPDYLRLREAIERLGRPQVLAFTATATPQVREDSIRELGVPDMAPLVIGFDRPNLFFEVRNTPAEADKLAALKALLTATPGSGIIYVGTRADAELVADFIRHVVGEESAFYHGGLPSEARVQAQDAFMSGAARVVAATKAFGMGIDKPDIRFIIHYRLPSSVEAYYQEAGRAGRDGKLSQCVLLYSPEDRALQEYFIESACPTEWELRSVFDALRQHETGRAWAHLADDELLAALGLPEVKVEVCLSCLERLGAFRRVEDAPGETRVEILQDRLDRSTLREAAQASRRRQEMKREMLRAIIGFAESNECRRGLILRYFGDPTQPTKSPNCCDNCAVSAAGRPESAVQADAERWEIGHAILRCVQALRVQVGMEKLVGILAGSKAGWVSQFGYDRLKSYGRLAGFTQAQIGAWVDELRHQGLLKQVGGEFPVFALSASGERTLEANLPVALSVPARAPASRPVGRSPVTRTTLETLRLFREGKPPEAIARERGLTRTTILGHLAALIEEGLVQSSEVVSGPVRQEILHAIEKAGMERLSPIKAAVHPDITYEEIRCVVASLKAAQAKQAQQEPVSLPAQEPPAPPPTRAEPFASEEVRRYLDAIHPRELPGDWDAGYAVDFTGRFLGSRYQRSKVGEWLFRFKYRRDPSPAPQLADLLVQVLEQRPELREVDAIVAVPPFQVRTGFDPVSLLAQELSQRTGLPVNAGLLERVRATGPQKDMTNEAQKRGNVLRAFRVKDPGQVLGRRILLLDDFYDSGATLNECARTIRAAGAAAVLVLTVGKTIHH